MRVLIIGGTGFIGRFVTSQLLDLGDDVIVVHRGGSPFTELRDDAVSRQPREILADRHALDAHAGELRAIRPDVVVDTILSSGAQAELLARTFRGAAGRLVVLSSMDVYRACGVLHRLESGPLEPLPLTEESALRTQLHTYPPEQVRMLQQIFGWVDDDYDKIPVERAVMAEPQLPATVLRLPIVYGPGDPLHRVFPIVKRIEDGRARILIAESVSRWRGSRGYVENVATAIVLATRSDRAAGRIYNVGEAETLTELEWARAVASVLNWTGDFVVLPDDKAPRHLQLPANLDQHWIADSSRIRHELGYREVISPSDALRRTVAWERTHPPPIDPAQFDYTAEDAAIVKLNGDGV
jgi:nucleoside-diphosphate-sugar epimerase